MEQPGFLNFSEIDVPTANYVEPGQYLCTVSSVKLEDSKNKQGQSKKVLKISFKTKDDKEYTENFYLQAETPDKTKKALGRLQYLHEAVFGSKISESFTSYDEMEAYFKARFTGTKAPKVMLLVSGEMQEDGKVYSRLGFADFIFTGKPSDFEEKVFQAGTPEYNKAVTKKKTTAAGVAAMNSNIPVLNPALGATAAMPWEKSSASPF